MFSTGAQAGTERSTKPGGSGILGGGPQTEDAKVSHVKSALDLPATVSGKPATPNLLFSGAVLTVSSIRCKTDWQSVLR